MTYYERTIIVTQVPENQALMPSYSDFPIQHYLENGCVY